MEKIVAQFHEDLVEEFLLIPQERTTECTVEHFVDVPGPRVHEDVAEVSAGRCVGAARSITGSVKKWFKRKGFGFITPDDGGEDQFFLRTQLVDTEGLRQENTVSYDTDYGKCKAVYCIVTSSGGGGNHDDGGDDVFIQCKQWTDTGGLRQGNSALDATGIRRPQRKVRSTTEGTIHNISLRRTVVGGWRWPHFVHERTQQASLSPRSDQAPVCGSLEQRRRRSCDTEVCSDSPAAKSDDCSSKPWCVCLRKFFAGCSAAVLLASARPCPSRLVEEIVVGLMNSEESPRGTEVDESLDELSSTCSTTPFEDGDMYRRGDLLYGGGGGAASTSRRKRVGLASQSGRLLALQQAIDQLKRALFRETPGEEERHESQEPRKRGKQKRTKSSSLNEVPKLTIIKELVKKKLKERPPFTKRAEETGCRGGKYDISEQCTCWGRWHRNLWTVPR